MTPFQVFSSACVLLLAQASAADLSSSYEWRPMKIGGGGWIVGMSINPAAKNLFYARADVSGGYRWDPVNTSWKQMVTASSMPPGYVSYGKYSGVDSIVGAPSDASVAYMSMGAEPYKAVSGQVFRSTNRGDTWTATQFHKTGVKMEANGEGRQDGERLAVDPVNSSVVYYASIMDGLWRTANAGESWTKIAAIPAGKAPHGVTTVLFDPAAGPLRAADGSKRTKVAYISVEEGGIFQTQDGGEGWIKISDSGPGDSGRPRDAALGPDSAYYVVFDGENGGTGSVCKYAAGMWTDITPQGQEGGKDKPYWAIAVDPFDPHHVIAMIHGGKTFVSSDQGATGPTISSPSRARTSSGWKRRPTGFSAPGSWCLTLMKEARSGMPRASVSGGRVNSPLPKSSGTRPARASRKPAAMT